mmetsp:Transcript_18951/g.57564  ORF Transcript_18951/g.57564 Transcript_18951/m.57564 type:complete len:207 (+) Transcript_18951:866-1486(+)
MNAGAHARALGVAALLRLLLGPQHLHLNAGVAHHVQPAAADTVVGVHHAHDDARHPGLDECLAAGRRAPVVAAGLQRHVGGVPRQLSVVAAARGGFRLAQRVDLGVRVPRLGMVAAAHDGAAGVRDDAAHRRVRPRVPVALGRQEQRVPQVPHIGAVEPRPQRRPPGSSQAQPQEQHGPQLPTTRHGHPAAAAAKNLRLEDRPRRV